MVTVLLCYPLSPPAPPPKIIITTTTTNNNNGTVIACYCYCNYYTYY